MTLGPVTVGTHRPWFADMPSRLGSGRPRSAKRGLGRREVVGAAAVCAAGVSSQCVVGTNPARTMTVVCVRGGHAMTGDRGAVIHTARLDLHALRPDEYEVLAVTASCACAAVTP